MAKPTAIRWRLYALLLMVVTLRFVDRFDMNVATNYIQQEYSRSDIQIGSLLGAIFQAPGGWLGDRFGPCRVLTWAILWRSAFTAFTAVDSPLPFWIVRFLIAIGEGPARPCINKMIGRWMSV